MHFIRSHFVEVLRGIFSDFFSCHVCAWTVWRTLCDAPVNTGSSPMVPYSPSTMRIASARFLEVWES